MLTGDRIHSQTPRWTDLLFRAFFGILHFGDSKDVAFRVAREHEVPVLKSFGHQPEVVSEPVSKKWVRILCEELISGAA